MINSVLMATADPSTIRTRSSAALPRTQHPSFCSSPSSYKMASSLAASKGLYRVPMTTTTITPRTDAPLPLPRPIFRTPPTQAAYDLPPTVVTTTIRNISTGGDVGTTTREGTNVHATITTTTSSSSNWGNMASTTTIPYTTTMPSTTTNSGVNHIFPTSTTTGSGSGNTTIEVGTPHTTTTIRGGNIITPAPTTSSALADVENHIIMPTTHRELISALSSFDTSGDGAWKAVISTITSHADRNYLAFAHKTTAGGRVGTDFISSVRKFGSVPVGTLWARNAQFQDQLMLLHIMSTRHLLTHVLAIIQMQWSWFGDWLQDWSNGIWLPPQFNNGSNAPFSLGIWHAKLNDVFRPPPSNYGSGVLLLLIIWHSRRDNE